MSYLLEKSEVLVENVQTSFFRGLYSSINWKNRLIGIKGARGTGKTTLMAKFINDLVDNKICKRIVMAAPTHKAVNIAKSKLFPDSEKDYTETLKIIKRLEHLIYIHCKNQILAGADVIQLFDSWAGLIKKKNLKEFCINPNKNIVNKIKKNFPNNPVICFPKGINKNINNFIKEVNPHGISIDYDINLKNLNLNNDVVFQGGMNPKFLLGNNKRMFEEAKKYLDFFKNKPYIFNLGHGILPKTKPENVKRLVEFVRSYNL